MPRALAAAKLARFTASRSRSPLLLADPPPCPARPARPVPPQDSGKFSVWRMDEVPPGSLPAGDLPELPVVSPGVGLGFAARTPMSASPLPGFTTPGPYSAGGFTPGSLPSAMKRCGPPRSSALAGAQPGSRCPATARCAAARAPCALTPSPPTPCQPCPHRPHRTTTPAGRPCARPTAACPAACSTPRPGAPARRRPASRAPPWPPATSCSLAQTPATSSSS
jgi:hypothetical protein